MKTFQHVAALVCLALAAAACDRAVGVSVADAKPVAAMPVLYPPLAQDAADGEVYDYH